MLAGLSSSKGPRGRGWKNVTSPFYSCLGHFPGQNGMKYSHWSKIWVRDQNSQNIPAPNNYLKFFLLHFSQSPYLRSGHFEGKFWHWYCKILSFSVENLRVSSFPPQQAEFHFLIFLTVIGVKFVDITFSIMKSDKLVIGALLDSMIMNLGKGASVSLSEECNSFKLRLNFLFEKKAISVICFSQVLCSTTI